MQENRGGFVRKEQYSIGDLLEIMAVLRGEGGCPWDREQDHRSIRNNFLEETYEVLEAIDEGDPGMLREELGDVLLQVVFHARMEEEDGSFDFQSVCDGICKKLILRHPHIFAGVKADTTEQVLANWDAIKKEEKGQQTQTQVLKSVPKVFPALMRAQKLQSRAGKAGLDCALSKGDFPALDGMEGKPQEEREKAVGKLLFAAVEAARRLDVDAESSLAGCCDGFVARFEAFERLAGEQGLDLKQASLEEKETLWERAQRA